MNSGRKRYDHELLGSSFAHNAEQAHVPEPPGPQNIVTPCHGVPLWHTGIGGELDEILCSANECYNSWNLDGTVTHWQEPQ